MKRAELLIILLLLMGLSSCNKVGKADIDGLPSEIKIHSGPEDDGSDENVAAVTSSFTGITSIDQKTDSTLRLNWTPHADAVAYHIYDETSGTAVFITTVLGQASSSLTLTGLVPGQSYKFRVRAMGTDGLNDSNTTNISVTTNLVPDVPTLVTLLVPTTGKNSSGIFTARVSGVKNGDTVKLWSNNTCTMEIASGVAAGSSIDLTSSVLPVGIFNIHANSINSSLGASACTPVGVNFERFYCPTNYVAVEENSALGLNSFCVMKFEARNVAGAAVSTSAGMPWTNVDLTSAKTACTAIGPAFNLLSNDRWMAIARNIEGTASNWSGGVVGSGALYRGHSDEAPGSGGIGIADTNDPYDGTGNDASEAMGSGKEQRRTLTLANGEVIWDLAGNVNEWIDWSAGGAVDYGPNTCVGADTELPLVACAPLTANDYMPGNPAGIPAANYDSTYGLGTFFGGANGGAVRGGASYDGPVSGIYSLYMDLNPAYTWTDVGFRCVYKL